MNDKEFNRHDLYEEREIQQMCGHQWVTTTAGTSCVKCGKILQKNETIIECSKFNPKGH